MVPSTLWDNFRNATSTQLAIFDQPRSLCFLKNASTNLGCPINLHASTVGQKILWSLWSNSLTLVEHTSILPCRAQQHTYRQSVMPQGRSATLIQLLCGTRSATTPSLARMPPGRESAAPLRAILCPQHTVVVQPSFFRARRRTLPLLSTLFAVSK